MIKPGYLIIAAALLPNPGMTTALAHGTHDELLEGVTREVVAQPENHKILLARARLHLKQGNTSLAIVDIEAAEKVAGAAEAAYVRGLYYFEVCNYQAATEAFSAYLLRYPGHIPSLLNRARANKQAGRINAAIDDYAKLLELSIHPAPDYYLEMARIEAEVKPGGIDHALSTIDRGIEKLGPLVSLQSVAIQYELDRKNYYQALLRHESLRPWIGHTAQWKQRHKQLSGNLSGAGSQLKPES